MAELIVGSVATRLSELLIHEAAVLSKVESRVEDIRRKLVLMKAFLKDIESRGRVKDKSFIRFVEELNDVARNAGNVIETFLDISVRMPWIFSFVKRYKVGKEVERISERVREMYNRMKYEQSHLTNIGLVVETLPETSHNVASPYAEPITEKMMRDMPQRRKKYGQSHLTNLSVEDETLQAASFKVASPYEERFSKKMMRCMPQRRKKYDQSHLTNLSVVDENHSASCNVASPKATEAPAVVEKLWCILNKNLVANLEVKNVVEYGVGEEDVAYKIEPTPKVQRLRGRTQPPLNVRESNIIGFDDDAEILIGKLLSVETNRCITSIIGIEGIGKTTLARLIFDNVAIKDHFDYRVWVSARQDSVKVECKTEQIMSDQEATQTGKEDSTQIHEKFLKKKGCLILIVVDDVQTPLIWDTLKKTIPDMSTGCRLLLTSRSAKEVNLHVGQRTFMNQLLLLDDDNSWVLFKRNLKIDIPPELIKVGKEIAIKCGGLPSEILKIGDELSKKDITDKEWSSMLQQLNQYRKPWSETLNTIDTDLPLYLMRCLYYFVLFPAEFEIPTRRLIVLWVAEGLLHHAHQEPPEQVAERCLTELIDLNMVQVAKRKRNGKVKTCRLPNALRESSLLRRLTGTDSDSVSKKFIIRQVADHLDKNDICYNHIHSDIVTTSATMKSLYKDVLSFLSFDTRGEGKPGKDIGKFLDRCISRGCFLQLRVLDLERVYKPQLPENIARLSQLRYLGLRWTYLESLPSSISSLLKLQTLDLKHTYISILPSSIWKMQLRHLFLSETYRTRFPPHRRGNSLTDLQTLWGLFVDEKAPVKCGLDRLVNIRKLGLACQSMSLGEEEMTKQLDAVAEWILNLKYLQSLGLKSRKEDGQPGDLHLGSLKTHTELTDMYLLGILKSPSIKSVFPPSHNELTLSHSNLQKDSIEILGDLPLLQSLCLLAGSYIEETLHCKKGSFPQLYVLKLWKLKELKEWNIEEEAFPHLRQLEIRSCECLQMLPVGLEHISTLRELKLTTMSKNFVERVRGVDEHKIPSSCNALNCYIIAGEQQFTCNSLF